MFAQARYYLPEIGRFISEDSYKGTMPDIQSQNRYIYCTNNPLKYIDPSGHFGKKSQSWIQKGFGDIGSLLNSGSGEFIDEDTDEIESAKRTKQLTQQRANEIVGNIEEYSKDQAIDAGKWYCFGGVVKYAGKGYKYGKGVFKNLAFWRKNKKFIKAETKVIAKTETEIMEEFEENRRRQRKCELEKTKEAKPTVGNNIGLGKFGNQQKLEEHFIKHGKEFKGIYKNSDDYLQGAREVMKNGYKVQYNYKGEIRTGYVRFMENSKKGVAKFEFVGTNKAGEITTYHVESGKEFWKMLNGKNIPEINPIK